MAKKILIEGIIGYDINENQIRAQLEEANGEPIDLEINTPGGFVFNGITIFNLIKNYSQNKNNITATITGLAASMGSYIALAANKVIAYDNAIYMIHNVQSIAIGDYRELQKEAKEIESLTNLLANAYVSKTGKTKKEIRKMMDDESFFHGQEMKDAGFVDEIIKTTSENPEDKNITMTLVQGRIKDCFSIISESKRAKEDIKKAASLIDITALQDNPEKKEEQIDKKTDILPENKKTEVKKKMEIKDLNEFKNSYPEIFQEAVNLGISQNKEQVKAHIILGKQTGAFDKMIEFIETDKNVSEPTVIAEYMATGMKNQMKNARLEDNVAPLKTPENNQGEITKEDTEKETAKMKKAWGVK